MSLTLLIKYRQGDNILALAQTELSPAEIEQLQLFIRQYAPDYERINNEPYISEKNLLSLFNNHPNLATGFNNLVVKAELLKNNHICDDESLREQIHNLFPPNIQQKVISSITNYQSTLNDYFKSNTNDYAILSSHLTLFNQLSAKAKKLEATEIKSYKEFCMRLAKAFPPGVQQAIQDDFERSLENYFLSASEELSIFQNILNAYKKMQAKANALEIAGIAKYQNLIASLSEKLPSPTYKIVCNNLHEYREEIDQYFTNPSYSASELKKKLQKFLFLNSFYSLKSPEEFFKGMPLNDITGELTALKNRYADNYNVLLTSTDFDKIRTAHITINKSHVLKDLNTDIFRLNKTLDPDQIMQQLCAANNLIYPDNSLRLEMQPELDQYTEEYQVLLERFHAEKYSLESTKIIEKLCLLHIKFNELLYNRQNTSPNNGFYYITEQQVPLLHQLFIEDFDDVMQFSKNPSPKTLHALRSSKHPLPNSKNYCTQFCGADFMRMTGLGTITFEDQHKNIINIKQLQEELNTSDPETLGHAVLDKMHDNEVIKRTISYIAQQGASFKLQEIIMMNMSLCGYSFGLSQTFKVHIKVEGDTIKFESYISLSPLIREVSLTNNTKPHIFIHLKYDISLADNPCIQSFKARIATTRQPQTAYRLHVSPELLTNNKAIPNLLFKYKKQFADYLAFPFSQKGNNNHGDLKLSGINNLFDDKRSISNNETARIRNHIELVYQDKCSWNLLAHTLISIAKRKLNSSLNHFERNRYNALLNIGNGLLRDTIPEIIRFENKIQQEKTLNSDETLELFKMYALLSTHPSVLNNVRFNKAMTSLLNAFCKLLSEKPDLLTKFWHDKKAEPLLPEVLCGIIAISHFQKQKDSAHKSQYKTLKKAGAQLLDNLLKEAIQNLPDNPAQLGKGNFKRAVEVSHFASVAAKYTNNNLSNYNYGVKQTILQRKSIKYKLFAKEHLKPDCSLEALQSHNEIIKEIIATDKSKWFLRTAASSPEKELSKSRLLNILKINAKQISHGMLNYFGLLKIFNLRHILSKKAPSLNSLSSVLNPGPNASALMEEIETPEKLREQNAKTLVNKYIEQLKKIEFNTLQSYVSSIKEKDYYINFINNLLDNKCTNYPETVAELQKLYDILPATSPLKNILSNVFVPHFLSSQMSEMEENFKNTYFDKLFANPDLLSLALSCLLKTAGTENTVIATEFLHYIFEKIKHPESKKYFISRSFLNKLTDKELTQLAIIDKSGEVAKYILNTGFWDKWLGNHPSKKLNHVDITRIIMAHTDKEAIINRAFAAKSFFGGRDFSQEFLPEDLSCIYTYSSADLKDSDPVKNNAHLRSKLERGIHMQQTWLEMIVNAPLSYIKELIELTRLDDQYLAGLFKKHDEVWQKFFPSLGQERELNTFRNKLFNKFIELASSLFNSVDQTENSKTIIDILVDPMKKSFFLDNILSKLDQNIVSDAIARLMALNNDESLYIAQLFSDDEKLMSLLSPTTKSLVESKISVIQQQINANNSTSSSFRSNSSHTIDSAMIQTMGLSLSSIWSNTFSTESSKDGFSFDQQLAEADQIRPGF